MASEIEALVDIPDDVRQRSSELVVLASRIDRTLRQHTTSGHRKSAAKDEVAELRRIAGKLWAIL